MEINMEHFGEVWELFFLQLFVLPMLHLSSDAVKVKGNLENLKDLKIVGERKPMASGAEKGRLNRHTSSF